MKLLGLIGGVSPESTAIYYRLLNSAARERLGGEHSAKVMIFALDYGPMVSCYAARDWDGFRKEVVHAGKCLAAAGAQGLLICSNTTHLAADAVAAETQLPLISIYDSTAAALHNAGCRRPLLLGTPVVMSGEFYRPELERRFDGELVIPSPDEQSIIGRIILDELVNGEVLTPSRAELTSIIARHEKDGADGVILGCTELCMILNQADLEMRVFDTTALHAAAASAFAFERN